MCVDICRLLIFMKREKIKKKIFAVSDIHGCASALERALDESGFDRKNPDHLLVVLGDLFDRGNENRRVLEYLSGIKNKILIRGNHEDILMQTLTTSRVDRLQIINGTLSTLTEFFTYYHGESLLNTIESSQARVADMLIDLIESMYDYFETDRHIFVHGWITEDANENDFRYASLAKWHHARWLRWHNLYPNFTVPDGKTLVVGHTPCYYGSMFDKSRSDYDCSIFYGNNLVAIDGAAVSQKRVNVYVTEDMLLAPMTHDEYVNADEMRCIARGRVGCHVIPFCGTATEIRTGDKIRFHSTASDGTLTATVTAMRLCHDVDTLDNERFNYDYPSPSPSYDRAVLTLKNSNTPALLLIIS